MKDDIVQLKEDVDEIKFNTEVNTSTINALSEWAEAVRKNQFRDIHYPPHNDEKLT